MAQKTKELNTVTSARKPSKKPLYPLLDEIVDKQHNRGIYYIPSPNGRIYLSVDMENQHKYSQLLGYAENDIELANSHFKYSKVELKEHHLYDHYPKHSTLLIELSKAITSKHLTHKTIIKHLRHSGLFLKYMDETDLTIDSWYGIQDSTIFAFVKHLRESGIEQTKIKEILSVFSYLFDLRITLPQMERQKKIAATKGPILALPSSVIYQLQYFAKMEYEELKRTYTLYLEDKKHHDHRGRYSFREKWAYRPHSHDVYPLVLLLLLKHGMNFEVLKSWKVHKSGDSYSIGDDTGLFTVIDGIKNRSNSTITTVIKNDSLEKKYIDLFLEIMNEKNAYEGESAHFFRHHDSHGGMQKKLSPAYLHNIAASPSPYRFYKKYEILNPDGSRIENLEHRRLRPSHNYQQYLQGKTEFERQLKKGHKNGVTTAGHYENSAEWKGLRRHKIAVTQNILVAVFKGEIVRSDNPKVNKALKLFNGPMADCKNNKCPTFDGAPKLKDNQACSDWTKCLTQCEQSCVIPKIHGPVIYAWINYLEEQREEFLSMKDWEKEYLIDYEAAKDTVSRFMESEKEYSIQNADKHKAFVRMRFNRVSKIKEVINGTLD